MTLNIILAAFSLLLICSGFSIINSIKTTEPTVNNTTIVGIENVDYLENTQGHMFRENLLPVVYGESPSMLYGDTMVRVLHNMPLMETQTDSESIPLNIDTNNLIFVGNSLVEGLRLYSNSDNLFFCKIGISLDGLKSEIYNQLLNYNCDTVVIGMGTNELGHYSEESFKKSYTDLINHIRGINPDSIIICLSIPPVSQSKSDSDSNFNNSNAKLYSGYIQALCEENQRLYYIDNSEFFGDVLSSDRTGDGIHLYASVYGDWYNFIINKIAEL